MPGTRPAPPPPVPRGSPSPGAGREGPGGPHAVCAGGSGNVRGDGGGRGRTRHGGGTDTVPRVAPRGGRDLRARLQPSRPARPLLPCGSCPGTERLRAPTPRGRLEAPGPAAIAGRRPRRPTSRSSPPVVPRAPGSARQRPRASRGWRAQGLPRPAPCPELCAVCVCASTVKGSQQQHGWEPFPWSARTDTLCSESTSLQAGTELGSALVSPLFSSACPRAFCEHPSTKVLMGTRLCLQCHELLFAAHPVPAVLGSLLLPSSLPTCSPSQPPDPGSPRGPSGLFPRAVVAQRKLKEGEAP